MLDGALDWIGTNRRLWDERFDKLDAVLAGLRRSPTSSGPSEGEEQARG